MKKKMVLLLAALLVATAAFGCAKKDNGDSDPKNDIVTPSEDDKNNETGDDQKGETGDDNSVAEDKKDNNDENKDENKGENNGEIVKPDDSKKDDAKPSDKPSKPDNTEQPEIPEVPAPDSGLTDNGNTGSNANTGDNGNTGTSVDLSGKTASDIISMIYEKKPIDLALDTISVDLTNKDTVKSYAGLTSADGIKEIAVSEPMMSSQAYSLVVVRVSDSANAASVAKSMKDGINPRKWVCVEADDIKAATYGDLVVFFMVDSDFSDTVTASDIMNAFKSICGGTLDSEI